MCKYLRPNCKITTVILPPRVVRMASERLPVRYAWWAMRPNVAESADKKTIKSMTESTRSRRAPCASSMIHWDLCNKETWKTIKMSDTKELINKSEGAAVSGSVSMNRLRLVVQKGVDVGESSLMQPTCRRKGSVAPQEGIYILYRSVVRNGDGLGSEHSSTMTVSHERWAWKTLGWQACQGASQGRRFSLIERWSDVIWLRSEPLEALEIAF
jgi:hypothetical protein